MKTPCIIAICGVKNSGKTTLIQRLLPRLASQGLKAAVIKHDGHDFQADVPGTDSYRHFAAGACGVAVYSSTKASIVRRVTNMTVRQLAGYFPEADLILCEGQKHSDLPKLELVRQAVSEAPVCRDAAVLGYVTDIVSEAPWRTGPVPVFGFEDIASIAGLIVDYYRTHTQKGREETMGKVMAVCTSPEKGTAKVNVHEGEFVREWGIRGDAHAGKWHRQVSLLSAERIEEFRARGAQVDFGAFGENLVVSGFDFKNLPVGTVFQCNDVVLRMTQIGKECHNGCAIYRVMGDCIMPREGVFCEVLHGGIIREGDVFEQKEENS